MFRNILEELKARNIFNNISDEQKFKNISVNSGVYSGFDPTAKSLHLGNYIQIANLLRFKQYGYNPVAIVGGITGMIGDPSFRATERQFLDENTLIQNKNAIKDQLKKFDLEVIDNLDFYQGWTMVDFLKNMGKMINVNYLLEKESIATRLQQGLSFTEFSYQLIQGWDFKTLYENNNVKIQIGGSDQWGNMTTGLEYIRKSHANPDAIVITANLLVDENGKKFGKSSGGGSLWLNAEMTSPYAIYQFLLNQSDAKIEEYLMWLTFLDVQEIKNIISKHNEAKHLRYAQKILAYEIVKDIHSKEIALQCQRISEILFGKNQDLLDINDLEMLRGFLTEYEINADEKFIDVIKNNQILNSNREIREFLTKKSFTINNEIIEDENQLIDFSKFNQKYALLRKGKKEYIILRRK
ncbi:tyrosyl tRNA synthetase [Metamycoplasma cloacale]|uniref:Tyrosine--tRNA ligase n=1 Tax=Metamycoplasma cloacale TaxID=92401 RepID=A0A2Z4LLZ6_9BACT|nr:tyrosine--tRNA ligase [Metamycoplasma cloacale]AWX42756.1 tyrosine--tRNA ligase [Metamycoplasma cloacale]VEU79429.1 tyrosyl tRNA synthetase [Metamycoplasma cloacale]